MASRAGASAPRSSPARSDFNRIILRSPVSRPRPAGQARPDVRATEDGQGGRVRQEEDRTLEPAFRFPDLARQNNGAVRDGRELDQQVVGHGAERSEEHTSELQSPCNLVCRLLLEKKKK